MNDFFTNYVSGAGHLPYEHVLGLCGLELRTRETIRPALGIVVERQPSGPLVVREIDPDFPAAKTALRPGDEILRWNNGELPRRPERWAASQKPGDALSLHVRHQGSDNEEDIVVHLGEVRDKYFQVAEAPHASEREKHIREGILHGTTAPVTAKVH